MNLIVLSLILGSLLGIFFPLYALKTAFLGDIFLGFLKMLIMPLIATSILSGVGSIGSTDSLGKLGIKTILYYLSTTLLAVIIGLILVNTFQPGKYHNGNQVQETQVSRLQGGTVHPVKITTVSAFLNKQIEKIFSNPFKSLVNGNVLGVIVFTIITGIGLLSLGSKSKPVFDLVNIIFEGIMKVVHYVIYIAPVGVFGLIASQVAKSGVSVFVGLMKYIFVVLGGLFIHMLALTIILSIIGKFNPLKFILGIKDALLLAFSTSSSSATMPVTVSCLEDNLNMPNKVVGFVIPLGATINMDGTALYEAVAALFIAQFYGLDLAVGQQIIIALTAMLAAVGAAGIPSAGLVTMTIVLTSVNLPLEGIGLILAVDRILDMCRTTVNVYGDTIGVAVVSRYFNNPDLK